MFCLSRYCAYILCVLASLAMFSCTQKSVPEQTRYDASLNDWIVRYDEAQTPNEKRAVCIAAIDQGIIHDLCDVKIIDQIFGSDFSSKVSWVKKGETDTGTIDFEPPLVLDMEGRLPQQVGSYGWYLVIKYNHWGQVDKYYWSFRDFRGC